jgi:phosphoglycolate phosphatase
MRPTTKAVLFDLDGTLADTIEDISAAVNGSLARRGLPSHGIADFKLMVGNGFRNLVASAIPLAKRTELLVEELRAEAAAAYAERCLERSRPYTGIPELLALIEERGIPMAVLSNKPHELTLRVVSGLFPEASFALVRGEGPEFARKPDPASALDIASRLGAAPEHCIYLGDSGLDMRMARSAGMVALGAGWGFRGAEELLATGAEAVLLRPDELLEFLP